MCISGSFVIGVVCSWGLVMLVSVGVMIMWILWFVMV